MAKRKEPTQHQSTISAAVSDAFNALEELGTEMRERYDNAPENLQQTDVNQRVDECANTLEGLSEPDMPECIAEVAMEYSQPTYGRRGPSRADRCSDACSILSAAVSACETWLEDDANKGTEDLTFDDIPADKLTILIDAEGIADAVEDLTDDQKDTLLDSYKADLTIDDQRGEVETCRDEVQQLIDEAEGCEFPGMFG